MGQASGGTVLRGHQCNQQHFPAWHLAVELDPGKHALHFRGVTDVDVDVLVHILAGFDHHQTGHQLADGSDGYHHVRVIGIDDFVGL
ncbi:hypothetical protein D3C81_1832290 [compost metagenome]